MTRYNELFDDPRAAGAASWTGDAVARAAETAVEPSTTTARERTDQVREVHVEALGAGQRDGLTEEFLISETVRDIERRLAQDDPDFARRMRRIEVRDAVNAVAVFAFLAVGAVLLVVGMATQTWSAYFAGAAAFLVSFGVDAHHQRVMRRANPR